MSPLALQLNSMILETAKIRSQLETMENEIEEELLPEYNAILKSLLHSNRLLDSLYTILKLV